MLCFQIHIVVFLFLISLKDTVSFLSPEERHRPVGLLQCFRSLRPQTATREGVCCCILRDRSWPR